MWRGFLRSRARHVVGALPLLAWPLVVPCFRSSRPPGCAKIALHRISVIQIRPEEASVCATF